MSSIHTADSVDCAQALDNLQAFLHGELDEVDAMAIRQHLAACEACYDAFHVEEMISAIILHANRPCCAPAALRLRIQALIAHVDC